MYAQAIKEAGTWHPVVVSLGRDGPLKQRLDELGIDNQALNSRFSLDFGRINALSEGRKVFEKLKPLRAHTWIGSSYMCNLAVGVLGPLAGVKQRIWWQKSVDSTIAVGRIEKWARHGITEYAANGLAPALHLQQRLQPQKKIRIAKMLNLLDSTDCLALEQALQRKNSEFRMVLLANYFPEKLHELLIQALAQLQNKDTGIPFRLDIFGNEPGGQGHKINCAKALAYDLGLSGRVFFHTSNAQKQEVIQQAHVGVLPTLSEGYSNALMEYMAAGLPVLASDILANRDVLGSDYASAFFKNTAESLATAVLELMHNEALRQEMGKANRHRILKLHRFDPANQWPFSNQAVHYFDLNENQEYQ